jgi:hypothetical protein
VQMFVMNMSMVMMMLNDYLAPLNRKKNKFFRF